MSAKQISQWRTVAVVVAFGILLFVAFLFVMLGKTGPTDGAVKLFDLLSTGLFLFAMTAAGKSATEHLAGGGGVKGAWKSLTTSAKPGEDAPSEAAPPAPAPPAA